jgi:hypothetical protein
MVPIRLLVPGEHQTTYTNDASMNHFTGVKVVETLSNVVQLVNC